MTTSLVYLLLRQVLQMLTQIARDGGAKDVEILVSRHEVALPRRQVNRDLQPADRVVSSGVVAAAAPSALDGVRPHPATLPRRHRELPAPWDLPACAAGQATGRPAGP